MKAIFVESYNGYLAKGPNDDMSWTPSLDKKIFKLLTYAYGGVCVVSRNTYQLLPKKMLHDGNRKFIIAEKCGPNSLYKLNMYYPDAVLIGGPRFLMAAYEANVIDTFIITTTEARIHNNAQYENPFIDVLLNLEPECTIKFDTMTIRVYENKVYRHDK